MIGFPSVIYAFLVEDLRKARRAGLVGPRKLCNGFDGGEKTQGRFGPQAEVEVFCPDAPLYYMLLLHLSCSASWCTTSPGSAKPIVVQKQPVYMMCTKKMRGRLQASGLQASGQVSYLLLCLMQTAYHILGQSGPVRRAAFHSSAMSNCSQACLFGLFMNY